MQNERELYRAEQLPIFQNRMYQSVKAARECPRGDIRLVQNRATGLIYNADFHPKLMTYDASYQNEQAVSPQFQKHLDAVVQIVERAMGRAGLVEVGCGKGYFLEVLSECGFDITGFDPTYEGINPRVKRHYFEPGVEVAAQGLILRHVLEHVQGPLPFLENLRAANAGAGLIYIEVPCFDWICEHRAWFDVFYEHVNYFRLMDFKRMFGRIIESGHLFGGQYLYVVADLASLKTSQIDTQEEMAFPNNFLRSLDDNATRELSAVWGGIQGRNLLPAQGAARTPGRSGHRHQPCQTRKIPPRHRIDGSLSGGGPRNAPTGSNNLHHELKLPGRNKANVQQRLPICEHRS